MTVKDLVTELLVRKDGVLSPETILEAIPEHMLSKRVMLAINGSEEHEMTAMGTNRLDSSDLILIAEDENDDGPQG